MKPFTTLSIVRATTIAARTTGVRKLLAEST
jgi:hypothetical protein